MKRQVRHRQPPLRLDPEKYDELRLQVLKRDKWNCQDCGALRDLEVHHIKPRSQLGDDREGNLITLCSNCHRQRH